MKHTIPIDPQIHPPPTRTHKSTLRNLIHYHKTDLTSRWRQRGKYVFGLRRVSIVVGGHQQIVPGTRCQVAQSDGGLGRRDIRRLQDPVLLELGLVADLEVQDRAAAVVPGRQTDYRVGRVEGEEVGFVWGLGGWKDIQIQINTSTN